MIGKLWVCLGFVTFSNFAFADNTTISSSGFALENTPSGAQVYGFFNQVLASQIYYEGRIYAKYNYLTQNPVFPTVQQSSENNPYGYGMVGKFGYNFHANDKLDILPYIRFNYYHNMALVYEDTNGDFIHSDLYGALLGMKLSMKVTPEFTPYADFYSGYQQVDLTGSLIANGNNPAYPSIAGVVNQLSSTMELGAGFKASQNISLIPFIELVTTSNYPNGTAGQPYSSGGFNINSFTSVLPTFGMKLSASW